MKKLTQKQCISKLVWSAIYLFIFSFTWSISFPGDTINSSGNSDFSAMHIIFNISVLLGIFINLIMTMKHSLDQNLDFDFAEDSGEKVSYFWPITIAILFIFAIVSNDFYIGSIKLWNTSVEYRNSSIQVSQEKETYYDNMWKSEFLKDKILERNKSTFIEVTKELMKGRHDGDKLAWKWVQENQPVPYSEFTKFYSDLSAFIESQRAGYLALEKKSQEIARENNTMLDTFPNNFYNIVLRIPHINYEAGFTSDRTQKTFTSKIENLQ